MLRSRVGSDLFSEQPLTRAKLQLLDWCTIINQSLPAPALEFDTKTGNLLFLRAQPPPILGPAFRLILPFCIRFMAKSRAPFGSFCQSRLCSSARRIPQLRAVLASAPVPAPLHSGD